MTEHITDKAAKALRDDDAPDTGTLPGPSPNPRTNALIHEIVLRSVGRLSRETAQKALLGKQYGSQFAKNAVENKSLVHTLATYGIAKVATRSLPGALAVGGGLVVKTLFDRAKGKRAARRAGEKSLRQQAAPD